MERQQVQRANDCIPQRRRPGAVYRDHEILRNIIKDRSTIYGFEKWHGKRQRSHIPHMDLCKS